MAIGWPYVLPKHRPPGISCTHMCVCGFPVKKLFRCKEHPDKRRQSCVRAGLAGCRCLVGKRSLFAGLKGSRSKHQSIKISFESRLEQTSKRLKATPHPKKEKGGQPIRHSESSGLWVRPAPQNAVGDGRGRSEVSRKDDPPCH